MQKICLRKKMKNYSIILAGGMGLRMGSVVPKCSLKLTEKSILEETIYENRFNNVFYLNKMGCNINILNNQKIEIFGPTDFVGNEVVATDLRAGACMVLAGLVASGRTVISDVEHILRGYENIIEKLSKVGASIYLETK